MTIEERVKEVVAKTLGITQEKIQLESSLIHDLGADSLNAIEVTMALEEEFDIEIPDANAAELRTVQNIINYIEKQV